MWVVSQTKTWIWLYGLLALLLIYKYRNWKIVLLLLAGMVVAVGLSDWLCSGVIKPLVCRLRPTHEPALDPLHLVNNYIGGRYGFCSSHAANTMSIALLFSLVYRNKYATVCLMAWHNTSILRCMVASCPGVCGAAKQKVLYALHHN